jgi:hypothetical protein
MAAKTTQGKVTLRQSRARSTGFALRLAAALAVAGVLGYVGIAMRGRERHEPAHSRKAQSDASGSGGATFLFDNPLGPQAVKVPWKWRQG